MMLSHMSCCSRKKMTEEMMQSRTVEPETQLARYVNIVIAIGTGHRSRYRIIGSGEHIYICTGEHTGRYSRLPEEYSHIIIGPGNIGTREYRTGEHSHTHSPIGSGEYRHVREHIYNLSL